MLTSLVAVLHINGCLPISMAAMTSGAEQILRYLAGLAAMSSLTLRVTLKGWPAFSSVQRVAK